MPQSTASYNITALNDEGQKASYRKDPYFSNSLGYFDPFSNQRVQLLVKLSLITITGQ